jgi:ferredoxin
MKKIYYFSGTGNTLWSAKKIAQLLGDDCTVFNIAAEMRKPALSIEAEMVIFLFPVYAYQTPLLVRRFLTQATIRATYIAALVTFGSDPGGALAEVYRILKRKKVVLSFAGSIPAVENYIPIFGPPSDEKKEKYLALQKNVTETMALAIKEQKTNQVMSFRPFSGFISFLFRIAKPLFVKGYTVTDRCNGCALCAKICPAGAISILEHRPVFSGKCEHCQACLNWCTMRAIRYIRINPDSKRYHHPEVKVAEMLIDSRDTMVKAAK